MNNSRVNENTVSSSFELNHLFIADSLQLTDLTSRFGGAESFATSISLEKHDRFVSSSCPYFWRQFSAILAASQPLFCRYSNYRIQYKGRLKKFFASKCTVLKLQSFSVGRSQIDDKKID